MIRYLLPPFLLLFSVISPSLAQKYTGQIKYSQLQYDADTLSAGIESKFHLLYKNNEITILDLQNKKHIKTRTSDEKIMIVMGGEKRTLNVYSYQNLSTKSIMFNENYGPRASFSVRDEMSTIPWKLLGKSKKIQNIECFSAQAEYRGHIWTAWYAPSIPVSSGPWLLYGLPGMILEAHNLNKSVQFICEGIISPLDKVEISKPKSLGVKNETSSKYLPKLIKEGLENTAKMLQKDKVMSISFGVNSIEIFDFEKDMAVPRFQQKLSDIPKK